MDGSFYNINGLSVQVINTGVNYFSNMIVLKKSFIIQEIYIKKKIK